MRQLTLAFVALLLPAFAFAQTQTPVAAPADAKARAEIVLQQAREALGGATNLTMVKSLQLQGEFKGLLGNRPTQGDFKIELLLPDKMLRTTTVSMGPMSLMRTETVNGSVAWFDIKTTMGDLGGGGGGGGLGGPGGGGMGGGEGGLGGGGLGGGGGMGGGGGLGGGRGGGRGGGGMPGGANGPGRSGRMPGMGTLSPEMEDQLKHAARADFARLLIAVLLATPDATKFTFTYEKEVEGKDGKIDALRVIGPDDFVALLLLDQKSHRPAMLAYRALAPRSPRGAAQPSNPDEEAFGPKLVDYQLYFSDHRPEGNLFVPHRIVKVSEGQMIEEWKLNKFKLNPDLKPNKFEKKK